MALAHNPYEQYQKQNVMTAGPVELVIMLYDGCLKQLKLARMAMEKNAIQEANTCMQKSQDILSELMMSLGMEYAISKDLMRIYDYLIQECIAINITKDASKIGNLLEILMTLREAWAEVQKKTRLSMCMSEE